MINTSNPEKKRFIWKKTYFLLMKTALIMKTISKMLQDENLMIEFEMMKKFKTKTRDI